MYKTSRLRYFIVNETKMYASQNIGFWVFFLFNSSSVCFPPPLPLQHYTKDADGLCTRLIKPKLMEGTVAAQDEFSRSKSSLHPSTVTRAQTRRLVFVSQPCHIQLHTHTQCLEMCIHCLSNRASSSSSCQS